MAESNGLGVVWDKAKKRAEEIFRPAPPEIEEELKKEKTLGAPTNLVRPDNKNE